MITWSKLTITTARIGKIKNKNKNQQRRRYSSWQIQLEFPMKLVTRITRLCYYSSFRVFMKLPCSFLTENRRAWLTIRNIHTIRCNLHLIHSNKNKSNVGSINNLKIESDKFAINMESWYVSVCYWLEQMNDIDQSVTPLYILLFLN